MWWDLIIEKSMTIQISIIGYSDEKSREFGDVRVEFVHLYQLYLKGDLEKYRA